MQRQITQFDNGRTNATVATPTCSSCCCCCCCLTTTITSSTLLARRINREARAKRVKDPVGLTVLAALFLPVIGVLAYLLVWAIDRVSKHCSTVLADPVDGLSYQYQYCSQPAHTALVLVPVGAIVSISVLAYLYARVKMKRPVLRAAVVAVLVSVAFVGEGIGGGLLLLRGFALVYVCAVPILFVLLLRFYNRNILNRGTTVAAPKPASWRLP